MKRRLSFILGLIVLITAKSFGQTVTLNYNQEPLNDILLDLNDRFRVQFSVDPTLGNRCLITINKQLSSMEEALQQLADRCGLNFVKVAEVYVFQVKPVEETKPERKPPTYLYQGSIVEDGTEEPLPFSVVKWPGGGTVSDENGRFSFKSTNRQEQGVFRYLGYETRDTLVQHSNELIIVLEPSLTELEAIEVIASEMSPLTNLGGSAGHLKFTDINNNLVPGLSDNLIFNNLRLYPGIMAAGESISDFVIWGSYAGQNHVIYDGITLFNSWGVNDDMGRVNPYMIKNVEVYKGGYNVQHGDRIGGVVLMDAKSGNRNSFGSEISLTNQLANAYLNIPLLNNRATLQVAGRKTIFDSFDLSATFGAEEEVIVPQYDYTDFNLKFTTAIGQADQLEISTIYSEDDYLGSVRNPGGRIGAADINISSSQKGSSLKYSRNWSKGGITNFSFSQSQYEPEITTNFVRENAQSNDALQIFSWNNPIEESRVGIKHTMAAGNTHQLQIGSEYIKTEVSFESRFTESVFQDTVKTSKRYSFYMHDHIWWTDNLSMQLGLKADVPTATNEIFWQPRINARYDINAKWNIHVGWGKYNQFLSKNSVVDDFRNRSEVWQMADGTNAQVLESTHKVLGINYSSSSLELGLEAFRKDLNGFKRFFAPRNGGTVVATGEARIKGIEFFAKQRIKSHEFWASYTLSEVEERFPSIPPFSDFQQAPQSQQHEVKGTAAFNFGPIMFSVTNVYGSGFPNSALIQESDEYEPYWRTDLAFQYRFDLPKTNLEAGFSVLNLFNNRNVRLNQAVNGRNGTRLNTAGIPFTPTIYVNWKF